MHLMTLLSNQFLNQHKQIESLDQEIDVNPMILQEEKQFGEVAMFLLNTTLGLFDEYE